MSNTVEIFVPNINPEKGFAFAYATQTPDQVYVPPSIVQRFKIKEQETIEVHVVPNNPDKAKDGVPWRAVGVARRVDEQSARNLKSEVHELVKDGGLFSVADLAEELNVPPQDVPLRDLVMVTAGPFVFYAVDLNEINEIVALSRGTNLED